MIHVGPEEIDPAAATQALLARAGDAGGLVTFLGRVRMDDGVTALTLEHYPGMTERIIGDIAEEAAAQWPLLAQAVHHRVGVVSAGDIIVFVGAAARHRAAAFAAASFLIDQLKTRAAFWKKESLKDGERWVEERCSDVEAAAAWTRG